MSNLKHLSFIINKHSRKGKTVIPQLTKALALYPISYDIHKTNNIGHAKELAKKLGGQIQKGELLVAVGGDGTLNEVVSGLEEEKMDIPVGYIPTGSGNDFARSHGFPLKLEKALAKLFEIKEPKTLDIITFRDNNERNIAINSVGVGIDGMVINKVTANKNKEKMGKFTYLASIISAYFSQKTFPATVELEEKTIKSAESMLVLAINNKTIGGGIPISPKSNPQDEILNVIIAEKLSFLTLLHILIRLLNSSHLKNRKLHSFATRSCKITIHSDQYGQKDGEVLEAKKRELTISTTKRKFWI